MSDRTAENDVPACEVHVPGRDEPSPWCGACRMAASSADNDSLESAVEAVLIADARLTEPIPMALAEALDNLRRCRYGERAARHTLATCEEGACDYCASYVLPPAEKDATADLLALVKTHRPNYVTEGVWDADPARSTQYTRVKCDGDGCDFYAQDPSWYGALDRHSAHLAAEVLAARVTPPAATEETTDA